MPELGDLTPGQKWIVGIVATFGMAILGGMFALGVKYNQLDAVEERVARIEKEDFAKMRTDIEWIKEAVQRLENQKGK